MILRGSKQSLFAGDMRVQATSGRVVIEESGEETVVNDKSKLETQNFALRYDSSAVKRQPFI